MIESKPELYSESYKKHKENAFLTLIGFYKGYYFMFVMSTFFYIIKHSPTWIFPIVTANIINALTGGKASIGTLIFINGTVLALLLLMNFPMNYLHMHFRATAVRNAEAGLRSALIRKIQRISIPRQRELESGRLQNKIIRDVEAIETLSDQLFTSLLNIIINVIVALAVTVMKSRIVFIFFIVMVPVAGFLVYLFKQPIKKRNRAFREKMEDTAARVSEMVELVPVTRAHALENEEINKMDKLVNLIAEQGYRLDMIQTNFGAVSWIIFQLFQLLCLIFSAYLALNHYIGSGDVVLYQSYFTTIVSQVTSLLTLLPTISKGLESVTSIGEVLCIEEVEDYSNKKEVKELSGEFDFQNVSYNYPKQETEVIHNLNLHINSGETVAFVGESGAGKSTIMNMLVGFCIPTEGKILVDGDDMQELNLHSYREYLAVVPQETILFEGTIRDNILYGTSGVTEEEFERVVRESGLGEVAKNLDDGINTMVGEKGSRLSGGQRQRISIARALIRHPRVMILDEATSALDNISEKTVSDALANISGKCTTFIVAHRLRTVMNADKIYVLDKGKIIESGKYEELMEKKGIFYKMNFTEMAS